MDLPDGYFTRQTQFLLNGVPFEAMLGRSPADPLVLMLARGPAGYRFTAKAVQHAVPDAQLQRGEHRGDRPRTAVSVVRGQCWLSGHLRGKGEPVELLVGVDIELRDGKIARVNATLDERRSRGFEEARACSVTPRGRRGQAPVCTERHLDLTVSPD